MGFNLKGMVCSAIKAVVYNNIKMPDINSLMSGIELPNLNNIAGDIQSKIDLSSITKGIDTNSFMSSMDPSSIMDSIDIPDIPDVNQIQSQISSQVDVGNFENINFNFNDFGL